MSHGRGIMQMRLRVDKRDEMDAPLFALIKNQAMSADVRASKIIALRQRSPSPQRRVSKSTGKVYCKFGCGKRCTAKGVYEHERHHCPKNPHRIPKKIDRKQCVICGQWFNGHYLRVHMACVHAGEPAKLGRPPTREDTGVSRPKSVSPQARPTSGQASSNRPRNSPRCEDRRKSGTVETRPDITQKRTPSPQKRPPPESPTTRSLNRTRSPMQIEQLRSAEAKRKSVWQLWAELEKARGKRNVSFAL